MSKFYIFLVLFILALFEAFTREASPPLLEFAALLLLPTFVLACKFYADHKSETKHKSKTPPASEVTPNIERNTPASNPPSKPFQLCSSIWKEVYRFKYSVNAPLSRSAIAYLWTILFYCTIKHLRSQSIANAVYSSLRPWIMSSSSSKDLGESFYSDIISVYKNIAPMLNHSGIDPRTDSGIEQLWDIFSDYTYKRIGCPVNAKTRFTIAIRKTIAEATALYGEPSTTNTPPYTSKASTVQYSISLPSEE